MQIAVLEQHACGAPRFEQPKYPLGQLPDVFIVVAAACRMRRASWSCSMDEASVARGVEKGHVDPGIVDSGGGGGVVVVIVLARMVVMVRGRERMDRGLERRIEVLCGLCWRLLIVICERERC